MPFKKSDMKDIGESYSKSELAPSTPNKNKKYYPTIRIDTKRMPKLSDFRLGQILTLHAHGKVQGTYKRDNDPAEYTIELQKAGIKGGHNPVSKYKKHKKRKKKRSRKSAMQRGMASGGEFNFTFP